MARRRTRLELSLFPFLNILFGLIAVLILHIFFIIQMNGVEGSAIGRVDRLSGGQAGGEELERRLDERVRTLTDEIAKVERQRLQTEADLEQRKLLLELRRHQDLIPASGKGTAGVPIGAPVPAEWRMAPIARGGGDNLKRPILVEVGAESYVVHEFSPKTHKTMKFPVIPAVPRTKPGVPEPPLQAEPRLKAFLDGINHQRQDRYLLFLIRPEGIDPFRRISRYCRESYPTRLSEKIPKNPSPAQVFDFGYEPFSDQWLLKREAGRR
jgi:hypothetical protein